MLNIQTCLLSLPDLLVHEIFGEKYFNLNLVNDQLDAQLLYFIIRLLQSSTCFEQRRAHHQEVKFY